MKLGEKGGTTRRGKLAALEIDSRCLHAAFLHVIIWKQEGCNKHHKALYHNQYNTQ